MRVPVGRLSFRRTGRLNTGYVATMQERNLPRPWVRRISALWVVAALGIVVVSGVVAAQVLGRHANSSARSNGIAAQALFLTTWMIPSGPPSTPAAASHVTVTSLAPDTGTVRWQHREAWSPYHLLVNAVVVPGVVYVLGDRDFSTDFAHPGSSALLALRASDGSQLWRLDVGAWASQPVVDVDGNTIYLSAQQVMGTGAFSKVVYAVNTRDGSVRWRTELAHTGMATDSLTLSGGRLLLGASEFLCGPPCISADLFALDARDGHLVWHQPIADRLPFGAAAPTVDGDVVYYPGPGPQVGGGPLLASDIFAYSTRDGHALWHHGAVAGENAAGFVVAQGTGYAAAFQGTDPARPYVGIYSAVALDGATGTQRWSVPIRPTQQVFRLEVLAIQGSRLYVKTNAKHVVAGIVSYDETITALDRTSGRLLWQEPLGPEGVSLQADASTVYVGLPPVKSPGQGVLLALNGSDGRQRWKAPADPTLRTQYAPALMTPSEGLLFFQAFDNTHLYVYAAQARDGHILWRFTMPGTSLANGITLVTAVTSA
jgi:outer membrane protein assembly factor BamB